MHRALIACVVKEVMTSAIDVRIVQVQQDHKPYITEVENVITAYN